jgi:hypothetical protein
MERQEGRWVCKEGKTGTGIAYERQPNMRKEEGVNRRKTRVGL